MNARSKWRDMDFDDLAAQPAHPLQTPTKTSRRADFLSDTPVTLGAIGDVRGANVANVANVTGVVNTEKAKPAASLQSPDLTKPETAPLETDAVERAAIIEEGASVPREWADGYARLLSMRRPSGFHEDQWHVVLDGVGRFIDEWAGKAAALGWTAEEIFGAYPPAPLADHSRRGLALYLKPGDRIAAITADSATFENRCGIRQSRYRRHIAAGGIPVWRLEVEPVSAS